jgi:hypothetical protein
MSVKIVDNDISALSAENRVYAPVTIGSGEALAVSEVVVRGKPPWKVMDEAWTRSGGDHVSEP